MHASWKICRPSLWDNRITSCWNPLQVDDRMNGDGTGLVFGVNDPILGFHMVGVFTTIWAIYYLATRELGGQKEEDGLSRESTSLALLSACAASPLSR